MAQYYRIAALVESSIQTKKYERMLEEERRQAKPESKPSQFIDDEALDEDPLPPRKSRERNRRKRKGRWIYELQNVPGCKRLKKWVRIHRLSKRKKPDHPHSKEDAKNEKTE